MTKNRAELCEEMDAVIRAFVPRWKVVYKRESLLHRVISLFLVALNKVSFGRVNIDYMSSYWTTIGFTAAYPDDAQYDWDTRGHEGVHGRQAVRWTRPLMGFLYLFPQSLIILISTILGIAFSSWFLLGVVVGLLPWPAPFRKMWEQEAYCLSVMMWEWQWGDSNDYIKSVLDDFSGPSYFYMWPFTRSVEKKLMEARDLARRWEEVENKDPYINAIYKVVKVGGRLRGE